MRIAIGGQEANGTTYVRTEKVNDKDCFAP